MTSLEKKKEAFAAWNKNLLTDEQLKTVIEALTDARDSMEALGERGMIWAALNMRLMSAEDMMRSRKDR